MDNVQQDGSQGEKFFNAFLRPERSEGLHFFNAALDRGYAQFGFAVEKLSYFLSDWDETWVDLS